MRRQTDCLEQDGDSVIFFNFRGDRPREMTRAFVDAEFADLHGHISP
jgi:2,3-bisphosphoglycerate-independent phosphoglycerate mutase